MASGCVGHSHSHNPNPNPNPNPNRGVAFSWLSPLLLLLYSSAVAVAVCDKPAAIFVFGDSNSDTGGLASGLGFPINLPNGRTFFHRSTGRLSDGRLVIDFLCKSAPSHFTPYPLLLSYFLLSYFLSFYQTLFTLLFYRYSYKWETASNTISWSMRISTKIDRNNKPFLAPLLDLFWSLESEI